MVAADIGLSCGLGLGWRIETAAVCAARSDLVCFEVIAESLRLGQEAPAALMALVEAGRPVIPHGVGLGLGSGQRPTSDRIAHLADAATRLRAPFVSEHLAWVRAGNIETEHLLPVPRTRAALDLVVDHIRVVQDGLPCPLVIENIAALFRWPDDAIAESDFLAELVSRTGVGLLIDVANLHANIVNGFSTAMGADPDPATLVNAARGWVGALPASAIAYLHIAGGLEVDGFRHDTHAHPVADPTLAMTQAILEAIGPRPVVLERDDHFGNRTTFEAELDALVAVIPRGWHALDREPPRGANGVVAWRYGEALAARQLDVLEAALGDREAPAGFDAATIRRLGLKLNAKLAWVAARRAQVSRPPRPSWFRRLWSRP